MQSRACIKGALRALARNKCWVHGGGRGEGAAPPPFFFVRSAELNVKEPAIREIVFIAVAFITNTMRVNARPARLLFRRESSTQIQNGGRAHTAETTFCLTVTRRPHQNGCKSKKTRNGVNWHPPANGRGGACSRRGEFRTSVPRTDGRTDRRTDGQKKASGRSPLNKFKKLSGKLCLLGYL